jgi:flagellar basal-body rod protein FlgG
MIQAAVTINHLQHKLDLIGNNMANSQTTGYKQRQADFSSLLFQQINNLSDPANDEGRLTPDGIRVGSGARIGATNIDLSGGAMVETGRALDVALTEESYFFQMEATENGKTETRYTRDGSFYLKPVQDQQAVMLTTKDGNPVLGEDGPIIIPNGFDGITIQENGQIAVDRGNQTVIAGSIAVVDITRPRLLEAVGENAFRLPDLAKQGLAMDDVTRNIPREAGMLQSGALEQSNVDMAQQMTDMMMTQRSYQLNARTISMGDQMQGLINQLR